MQQRTYGSIERTRDGAGWTITALEPHVMIRLKAICPQIKKTDLPPITLSGPTIESDLDWFMQRYPLAIAADERHDMQARRTLFELGQAEIDHILAKDWRPSAITGFRNGRAPYPYQVAAAEIAHRTGRLLLMDDLGLGKTISGLTLLTMPDTLPAMVIVQTHLAGQWKKQIEAFTHLRVHIIRGTTPYVLPPADVYIFKYSNIGGWVSFAGDSPFKTVLLDEMQEMRHGDGTATGAGTGKGRAARQFLTRARYRMGLTATPIYNYGSEIWSIVDLLEPGALGQWWDFVREWCSPVGSGKWKVDDPQALGTFLRETHLAVKRSNEDVGNQFPPANVIMHEVPFDAEALNANEATARALAMRTVSGSFTERGQAAREFDLMMRHDTGVAKARHVAAFVRILLEAGQPVLLAGWHRDVYDIWRRELAEHRPALYTGSETPLQKQKTFDRFTGGDTNLMIISLRSGAGLDGLQFHCATVVFGELDWSPQVHAQVIGRLRRPGQTKQVEAIYLHTDGGSDPGVISVLGLKASQSHGIIDPLSAPAPQVSDASRIQALAREFLKRRGEEVPASAPSGRLPEGESDGAIESRPPGPAGDWLPRPAAIVQGELF